MTKGGKTKASSTAKNNKAKICKTQDCDCKEVCACEDDHSIARAVFTTFFCTLLVLLLGLIIFYTGMRMSGRDIHFVSEQNDVVDILPISYIPSQLDYELDKKDILQDAETSMAFVDLPFDYAKGNHAVIDNYDLYKQFLQQLPVENGLDMVNIDPEFFKTGSIVAVAIEGNDYKDIRLSAVSRNTNYDITVDLVADKIQDDEMPLNDQAKIAGRVFLVQVQNIKPKNVTVQIDDEPNATLQLQQEQEVLFDE